MIDIHTHILPACDDGSPDIDTSLHYLQILAQNKVSDVILTPHFIRNSYNNKKEIINPKFTKLKEMVYKKNIEINLHLAAEVYLEPTLIEDIKKNNFTINNSDYVLVETSFNGFPTNLLEILYQLVKDGYKPILAHPERYNEFIVNPNKAESFLYRDIYFQLNAGSFLGKYGKQVKNTAWSLLDKGYVHFLASDLHCKNGEYPLPIAAHLIAEKYDEYLVKLLTEINPQKLLNNEKIEIFYIKKKDFEKKSFWQDFKNFFSKL
mgnify:CR=1 FL=1